MTRQQLMINSLIHYWRTNLAVMLGVVVGTAVIGGALIVGESVRASLRKMTFDRLGQVEFVLSGPRFFREELAGEVQLKDRSVAPAIIMRGAMQAKSGGTSRRAGQVSVYGIDHGVWSLIDVGNVQQPAGTGVVLNTQVAEALHAKVGDQVTLWIEIPSAVPRDTLLGNKDNDSQEIVLTVSGIAPAENGLSRFGLNPTQSLPLNVFMDLHVLQERLGLEEVRATRRNPTRKPARINSLFVGSPHVENLKSATALASSFDVELRKKVQLADLNLRLVHNDALNCEQIESEQMILEDKLAEAARRAATEARLSTSPVMVYLANQIWNPKLDVGDLLKRAVAKDRDALQSLKDRHKSAAGYSMYSTVAGLDLLELDSSPFGRFEFLGEKPKELGENDVVINEWLADDLKVKVGDEIRIAYHLVGSRGELPEEERSFFVRGIVKMSGAAIDRRLTPEVKGITDVDSLADWDKPFDMELGAVTPRDDDYWDQYRATPKLFLPLSTARGLWPSRYGTLTTVRFASQATRKEPIRSEDFSAAILGQIDPVQLGLAFQPVKAIGLLAANGSTDFSGLFIGFSLFLIVAAMILIGLLFRLGVEQRVRDLGLLGAIGFSPQQVRWQMMQEGLAVVIAGGVIGLLASVGYAKLMIYGLTHWWVGAIGTRNLILHIGVVSLPAGFAGSVVASLISIWWGLRQLGGLSLREQLSGITEREIDLQAHRARAKIARRRAGYCTAAALLLTIGAVLNLLPAAAAFFGVGILSLVASLSFLSGWLEVGVQTGNEATGTISMVRGTGTMAISRLGLRNASRQRVRSVMTAGMIATATFLIVTVAAFRRNPTSELPDRKSGNGGFALVAETSSPILYDLNTVEGRSKLQLKAEPDSPAARVLKEMRVVPFRVKPGEDASCLNLYQTRVPTILGAPQSLIDEGRFAFATGTWKEIGTGPRKTDAIPVLGDLNTLMFSLHKFPGQSIPIPDQEHPQHELKIAGMYQDSVFQGVLVMNEADFVRIYPEQKGFQYFLIEVPSELADTTATFLETELAEYGFDAEPVAERLARFLSVQNTYLSTFQTLGGLGLLLGTFGLATVMLRNVLERQTELALLRAIGYRARTVGTLVLLENAFVLTWGLLAGAISALLAVAPNLIGRGGDVPIGSLMILLAIVFATGMLAAAFAVRTAVRLPIVATLRGN